MSLLWPAGSAAASHPDRLGEPAAGDLNVADLARSIAGASGSPVQIQRREQAARHILGALITDPAIITHRQAVLEDLLADPTLAASLEAGLPKLEALTDVVNVPERYRASGREALERVGRRLADLELLVEVARHVESSLADAKASSDGVQTLRAEVAELTSDPSFTALEAELPELRATLSSVRSVTVGINLAPDLSPESATILSFAADRVEGRRALLARMLGEAGAARGVTPLQRGEDNVLGRNELVRDMDRLLQQVAAPVASALRRYASMSAQVLAKYAPELAFLLGAARLIHRLHGLGLPTCTPRLLSTEERATRFEQAYDASLALRDPQRQIVGNSAALDGSGARVWILTGPNRSGKTTFVRSLGLAHVLAQAGLRVPATRAELSPVDAIFTHFPSAETSTPGMGRLDQEAERLAAIFRRASPSSLILLNEALAGTSSFEALDLARGIVRGLRVLGARAVYVTHLHELAAASDAINGETPGDSAVGSLVAEPGADRGPAADGHHLARTFRVAPGPPHGHSFAAEIAEQHGISFPHLLELLRQRGVVGE